MPGVGVMLHPGAALRKILVDTTAVTALVSTRIYPITAPQSAPYPRGTYKRVSEIRERHQTDASGLAYARIQFDWFTNNQDTLYALMEKADLALDSFTGLVTSGADYCVIGDVSRKLQREDWEPVSDESGIPIFRGTQDYVVSYNPAITER